MRKLSITLCLLLALLLFLPVLAAGEEEYHYTAEASTQLKMRRSTSPDASACGQIKKGDTVHVIEYDETWATVIKGRTVGYVYTKYLTDITPLPGYTPSSTPRPEEGEPEGTPAPTATPRPTARPRQRDENTDGEKNNGYEVNAFAVNVSSQKALGSTDKAGSLPNNWDEYAEPEDGFSMTPSSFTKLYDAASLGAFDVYTKPDQSSRVLFTLSKWQAVNVGEVCGKWCLVQSGSRIGYIPTLRLFRWDRVDPYAGEIPNLDHYSNILWVNHATDVYSLQNDEVLWTVNAGAALACRDVDEDGRYVVPIEREYGYIRQEDVAWVMPVVDWQDAQSGDLISTMTTFFGLGIHTLQYQGRNWNLHMAGTYISGTVLQPEDVYNQNTYIGPYSQFSNYKQAPTTGSSAYGGGTCQVNSTFYITLIQVPLKVIQRQVHQNVGMHYCKIGLDASVGAKDTNTLIMRNTLPYAIRFHYFVSDGVLTCAIFRD